MRVQAGLFRACRACYSSSVNKQATMISTRSCLRDRQSSHTLKQNSQQHSSYLMQAKMMSTSSTVKDFEKKGQNKTTEIKFDVSNQRKMDFILQYKEHILKWAGHTTVDFQADCILLTRREGPRDHLWTKLKYLSQLASKPCLATVEIPASVYPILLGKQGAQILRQLRRDFPDVAVVFLENNNRPCEAKIGGSSNDVEVVEGKLKQELQTYVTEFFPLDAVRWKAAGVVRGRNDWMRRLLGEGKAAKVSFTLHPPGDHAPGAMEVTTSYKDVSLAQEWAERFTESIVVDLQGAAAMHHLKKEGQLLRNTKNVSKFVIGDSVVLIRSEANSASIQQAQLDMKKEEASLRQFVEELVMREVFLPLPYEEEFKMMLLDETNTRHLHNKYPQVTRQFSGDSTKLTVVSTHSKAAQSYAGEIEDMVNHRYTCREFTMDINCENFIRGGKVHDGFDSYKSANNVKQLYMKMNDTKGGIRSWNIWGEMEHVDRYIALLDEKIADISGTKKIIPPPKTYRLFHKFIMLARQIDTVRCFYNPDKLLKFPHAISALVLSGLSEAEIEVAEKQFNDVMQDDKKDNFSDTVHEIIEVTWDQLKAFRGQKFSTFPNANIVAIPDKDRPALEISSDCRATVDLAVEYINHWHGQLTHREFTIPYEHVDAFMNSQEIIENLTRISNESGVRYNIKRNVVTLYGLPQSVRIVKERFKTYLLTKQIRGPGVFNDRGKHTYALELDNVRAKAVLHLRNKHIHKKVSVMLQPGKVGSGKSSLYFESENEKFLKLAVKTAEQLYDKIRVHEVRLSPTADTVARMLKTKLWHAVKHRNPEVSIIVGHKLDPINVAAIDGTAQLDQAASDLCAYLENFSHIEEVEIPPAHLRNRKSTMDYYYKLQEELPEFLAPRSHLPLPGDFFFLSVKDSKIYLVGDKESLGHVKDTLEGGLASYQNHSVCVTGLNMKKVGVIMKDIYRYFPELMVDHHADYGNDKVTFHFSSNEYMNFNYDDLDHYFSHSWGVIR